MTWEKFLELSKQVLDGDVWTDPTRYVVAITVLIIAFTLGKWFGGYGAKRGELKAINENYETLLAQTKSTAQAVKEGDLAGVSARFDQLHLELKTNTETVEKVKTAISHGDWLERERKTLRRQKLEKLMELLSENRDWQHKYQKFEIFQFGDDPGVSPVDQMRMIGLLYFPELNTPIQGYFSLHMEYKSLIQKMVIKMIPVRSSIKQAETAGERQRVIGQIDVLLGLAAQHAKDVEPYHASLPSSQSNLEAACVALFNKVFREKID